MSTNFRGKVLPGVQLWQSRVPLQEVSTFFRSDELDEVKAIKVTPHLVYVWKKVPGKAPYIARIRPAHLKDPKHAPYLIDPPDKKDAVADIGDPHKFGGSIDHLQPVGGADEVPITSKDEPPEPEDEGEVWEHPSRGEAKKHGIWLALKPMQYLDTASGQTRTAHGIDLKQHYLDPRTGFLYDRDSSTLVGWYDSKGKLHEGEPPRNLERAMRRAWKPMGAGWAGRRAVEMGLQPGQMRHPLNNQVMTPELPDDPGTWLDPESGLVYKDEQLLGWVDNEGDYIDIKDDPPDRHQLAAMIKRKAGKFLKKLSEPEKQAAPPEEPKAQEPEPEKVSPQPDPQHLEYALDNLSWDSLQDLATDPVMSKYFIQPAADKFNELSSNGNHAAAGKLGLLLITNLQAKGKTDTANSWKPLVDKQLDLAKEKEDQALADPPTPAEQPVSTLDDATVQGLLAQKDINGLLDRAVQVGLLYKTGTQPWISLATPLVGIKNFGTKAVKEGDYATAMHLANAALAACKAADDVDGAASWLDHLQKFADKLIASKTFPPWGQEAIHSALAAKDYPSLLQAAEAGSLVPSLLDEVEQQYEASVPSITQRGGDPEASEALARIMWQASEYHLQKSKIAGWKAKTHEWEVMNNQLGKLKDYLASDGPFEDFVEDVESYSPAVVSAHGQRVADRILGDALKAGNFDKVISIAKGMSKTLSNNGKMAASELFDEVVKNAENLKKGQEEEKAGVIDPGADQNPYEAGYYAKDYLQKALDTGAWAHLLANYSDVSPDHLGMIEASYYDYMAKGDFDSAAKAATLVASLYMNGGVHDQSDQWSDVSEEAKWKFEKFEELKKDPPDQAELDSLLQHYLKNEDLGSVVALMSVPGFHAGPAFLKGGPLHGVLEMAIEALPSASGAEWDVLEKYGPIMIKKAQLEKDAALESAWKDLLVQAKAKVKEGGPGIAAPSPTEAKSQLDPDSIYMLIQQHDFDALDKLPPTAFQYIHRHALQHLYGQEQILADDPGNEAMHAHLHNGLARISALMAKALIPQNLPKITKTWVDRTKLHQEKAKAAQEKLDAALAKKQPEEAPGPIAADKIDHVLAQNNSNETATWAGTNMATWSPDGVLNGVAFTDPPDLFWEKHVDIDFGLPKLSHSKHPASGVLVVEPDGRVWIVEPTNHYGGYQHTFPKGKHEPHLSLQQNALKEAYEESGLQVEIVGHLGDFEGDTSNTRYFIARRVGGKPWGHHWETKRVKLVPHAEAEKLLNVQRDKDVLKALQEKLKDSDLQQKLAQKNLPEDAEEKTTGTGIPEATVQKPEDVASSVAQYPWVPKPPKSKPTKKACKAATQTFGLAPNEFVHPVTKEVFAVVGLGKWEYVHPPTGTVYGKGGEVITNKSIVATGKSVAGTVGEVFSILMAPQGPTPSFPTPTVLPKPVPPAEPIDAKSLQVKALKSIAMPEGLPSLTSLTLKGGAKHLGGAGEKSIYEDAQGNKWLHKVASEKSGGAPKPYAVAVQVVWSQVAKKVLGDHLPVGPAELGGKIGTLQPLLALDDAQPDLAHVSPHKLSDADRAGLMKEHALDWLMSQHDSHGANFIRRAEDGKLFSVDKEQGFKYFGTDKLDIDYKPNTVLYGENEPYHNKLWRGWLEGKYELPLDELEDTLQKIMAIPTPEYIKMLRPYAEVKWPGKPDEQREFLRAARRRKLDMFKDFEGFLTTLHRKKHGTDGNFTFAAGWSGTVQNPKGPKVKKVTYDAVDYVKKMAEETGSSIKVDAHNYVDGNKVDLVDEFCVKFPNSMHPSPQEYAKTLFDKLGLTLPEPIQGSTQVKYVVPRKMLLDAKIEVEELVNPPATTHGVKAHSGRPRYYADDYEHALASDNFHELKEIHNAQFNGRARRVSLDGPNVVGSALRVHRVRTKGGDTEYRVNFKIPNPLIKELDKHGGGTTDKYTYDAMQYDANNDCFVSTGTPLQHQSSDANCTVRKWTSGNSAIHLAKDQWGEDKKNAYNGNVWATIQPKAGQTVHEALHELLEKMKPGLADRLLKPPTEEDNEKWKLMQTLWAKAPQRADALTKARTVDIPTLKQELGKIKVTDEDLAQIEEREVFPGYKSHVEKGRWQKLYKAGARVLFHGAGGSSLPSLIQRGCMGIEERDQHGIGANGQSESGDIKTGSANGVLSYFITESGLDTSISSHSFSKAYQIVIHPKEAERLDAYWHPGGDMWGTCTPFDNGVKSGSIWNNRKPLEQCAEKLQKNYSSSHETSFRRGISPKSILRIVTATEHNRAQAIQKFRQAGMNEINGVPVEDFVVLETTPRGIWEKYVKPVLEKEEL